MGWTWLKVQGNESHGTSNKHRHNHKDASHLHDHRHGSDTCDDFEKGSIFLEDIMDSSLKITDIERGSGTYEKIVLSVQGMTCSGCEKKLIKAFRHIPTIRNTSTSLVLARAEFEIDTSVVSVEKTILILKRVTNYNCYRVTEDRGQVLDILSEDPHVSDIVSQIHGVKYAEKPDNSNKKLTRIFYDPAEVGARELFEKHLAHLKPVLAPHCEHPSLITGRRQVRKDGILFLAAAMLTLPVLLFTWAPIPGRESVQCQATSLVAASLIQAGVAVEFYPSAFKSLFRSHVVEMDLLVVLSTTAAYVFSVVAFAFSVAGKPLETGSFFETSTLLATLILLGRYVNELARQKATESISVRSLQKTTALLVSHDRQSVREIDSRLLQPDDTFRVTPHASVVTDGVVVYGGSEVDESMVTGESVPVAKAIDSMVIAGSINGNGLLDVKLTKLPGQNTISTIAEMVDAAELSKPKVQAIADKVAGYFVPVIVALTMVVFAIWMLVGIYVQDKPKQSSALRALTYAIATLIISCPCAIGLAVPMVVVIAGGVAAKYGVIFKVPQTIEVVRNTTHIVLDKTGTLTNGRMAVDKELYVCFDRGQTERVLLGLLENVKHPVSVAVAEALASRGVKASRLDAVDVVPGSGVKGCLQRSVIRAGNARWLNVENNAHVRAILQEGLTVFCVELDAVLVAILGLKDTVRPEAAGVIADIKRRGIAVHVVSGDDEMAVQMVATQLELERDHIRHRCSPADKQAYVQRLLEEDPKSTVIFCGDGTNDAVALAQASVGIHISSGTGTEVSKSAADIVLIRPDLTGIIVAIEVSQSAFRRILFNFGWAAVYNVFAILLAAGAFVHARIPPEFAGLGEVCSVLPVVFIAFTLKFIKFGRINRK